MPKIDTARIDGYERSEYASRSTSCAAPAPRSR